MNDNDFMRMAIEESQKGDSPYGAVLVKDGVVIAKAFNTVDSEHDITAHAEINVIRKALKHTPELSLKSFTLYTSSESCPMCTGAILWAEISRVVFGASIQNLMELGLTQINTPSKFLLMNGFVDIDLQGSVLADEAIDVVKHCSFFRILWSELLNPFSQQCSVGYRVHDALTFGHHGIHQSWTQNHLPSLSV